jgi:hypothetical protein
MFGRSLLSSVSLVLALGSLAASPSHGQSVVAVEVGATTLGDEYESISLFETGLRFGSLRPKQVNADVRIATYPQALTAGVIVLSSDMDLAYVLPLGKGTVATPRGGFSLLAGFGGEAAAAAPGLNFGLGVVAGLSSPVGVRFDYSHRTYLGAGEGMRASSFSIGIVWVH